MGGPDEAGLLRRMVRIPSNTGDEDALAGQLVHCMTELGFAARRDGAGNAVGELGPPGAPLILLLGHLDTVPGDLPVYERDGKLYGRGTVDAKGPLATMVWAALRASARCDARLMVVGAVGEEGCSPGARHLRGSLRPDAVVIGEPSGVGNVVLGYKGIVRFAVDISRPGVHTSAPGPRAVEIAADYWQAVRLRLDADPGARPAFDRAIPALVALHGDLRQARVEMSCRIPVGFDRDAFHSWLRELTRTDHLTVIESLPAVRSRGTDPVVAALRAGIRRHVGPPTAKVKLGTSDMNVVGPGWNVPIAAYGPGDSRLDHTDEEHLDLAEYLTAIEVLTTAVEELAATLNARRDPSRSAVALDQETAL
ncbi:M20/M25/M40 family metallo-hydrolase [Streptomyces sp. SPB162]|uniref:M20/M25/M40 family metallo-hydrolase n=1 Tax=Streptomyces sp. SPB162 TaxID=2940560 RepID=UPI0024053840|nr:M20/M25/M40 family metallo-hydrolase [Streptomyces sp. SPB162]MDF9815309.1 LysW-gamma-L-lysine carboxypeptidase [Streptomyces sp. SPB162]